MFATLSSSLGNKCCCVSLVRQSYTFNKCRYRRLLDLAPRVTKLFRIRIKIRLTLKILLLWTFRTCYTYLTIDCWYLLKYVPQTRFLGILNLFYERKGKFYSCDHYENFSPLNNRINFTIVNFLQHVL